jgi:hypothetical protein
MAKKSKRGPGRPPLDVKAMMRPIPVRFPEPMIAEIEAIMAARMDQPDKGAVIRELVAEAIEARKARKKKG